MIKPNAIITLLTDFGESDAFVGTMKGVIYSINRNATIVDLSHQVPRHDIEAGAFVLCTSYRYFPVGTIHVAVVDPGVGTGRHILGLSAGGYYFLAPDNEILKYIFHQYDPEIVFQLNDQRYFLRPVSNTFHGRDIFAPLAAHLSNGVPLAKMGTIVNNYHRGTIPQCSINTNQITGTVIYIDRFGNLITNIPGECLRQQNFTIILGTLTIENLSNSYADVSAGQPLALIGSSNFLEIAVRNGNAQQQLNIKKHAAVLLKRKTTL